MILRTYRAEIVAYYKNEFKGHIKGVFFEGKFFLEYISGDSKTRQKLLSKLNSCSKTTTTKSTTNYADKYL